MTSSSVNRRPRPPIGRDGGGGGHDDFELRISQADHSVASTRASAALINS